MHNDNLEFYYNDNLNVMCILNKKNGGILTATVNKIHSNDNDKCWNWQIVISSTISEHIITVFMPSTYRNFEILGKFDECNNLNIEFIGNDGNCTHTITINRSYGYKYIINETYGFLIDQFMGKDTSNKDLYMPSDIGKTAQECVANNKTDAFFDLLRSKKSE